MNVLLVLIALVPRPEFVPVGQAELLAARQMAGQPAMVSAGASVWSSPADARVPGQFVVGFAPGACDAVGSWIAQRAGTVVRTDLDAGFIVADIPSGEELAATAQQVTGIRYFEPNLRVSVTALPDDPYFIPYQWDKWVMYADQAWDVVGGSMDVKVAVVDNGTEWEHPDLAASFLPGQLGYDFIGNDDDPRPDNTNVPESFHGTHVAGIIAATRDNGIGVAGWSLVQLLAVRVLNDSGSGTIDVVASGIRWAADHGARIVNMSLTSSASTTPMEEACEYARQKGVVLVAASGNDGQEAIGFPAALSQCIAVGATSTDSRLAYFSNYGAEQEVVAPGVTILSCVPGGSYGQADGTSMAAPEVSGVAALILARDYGLNAAEVRAILDASAIDMGNAGRDKKYGYGLVNARRAVDLATAFHAPLTVNREAGTDGTRTVIARRGLTLPSWIGQAAVFDCSGRLVLTKNTGTGGLSLEPGTYFVKTHPESSVQGPGSGVRLLVLD